MNNLSRVCLFLVVASLMLTFTSHAALIKGKTTVSSGAIAGVVVTAYPAEVLTFDGPAPHSSKATADDGLFSLELPGGRYYLFAEGAVVCFLWPESDNRTRRGSVRCQPSADPR